MSFLSFGSAKNKKDASLTTETLGSESLSVEHRSLGNSYKARLVVSLQSLATIRWLGIVIVFFTVVLVAIVPEASPLVYISAVPLFVLQLFATSTFCSLQLNTQAVLLVQQRMFPRFLKRSLFGAAGLAVRDSFFLLFLAFDTCWLFSAYAIPFPAASFSGYTHRLQVGPIDGTWLLAFTGVFWFVYAVLLFVGRFSDRAVGLSHVLSGATKSTAVERSVRLAIPVRTYDHQRLSLSCLRFVNRGCQPLILWPGFFQNGYVYHLIPDQVSLAEYLWSKGFDVWIIHPRGTGGSDKSDGHTSLDDFASVDVPAVIEHVRSHTDMKPIFVGHSQGGIVALMSMMGAEQLPDGAVVLQKEAAEARQSALKGLVTMGSFPDFSFSKPNMMKSFVDKGFELRIFGLRLGAIRAAALLRILRVLEFLPLPVGLELRLAMIAEHGLRVLLFPLQFFLAIASGLRLWQFLYNIPNVSKRARYFLFTKTMDGTFWGILHQFYRAFASGTMKSFDDQVNYSTAYNRIRLPVSIVGMECDTMAEPFMMKQSMFEQISSGTKFFTEWKGMGHEDHFMDPGYFPLVLEAIRKIC